MKINNVDESVYTNFIIIPNIYKKYWCFKLFKTETILLDSYNILLDIERKYCIIIKSDSTDYGLSNYSIFQNDFDIKYEFNLNLDKDIDKCIEFISNTFKDKKSLKLLNNLKKLKHV